MVQHLAAGLSVSEQFVYVHTVIKSKGKQRAGHIEHHNHLSIRSNCVLGEEMDAYLIYT